MKYKIVLPIKAHDEADHHTYSDQKYYELYDAYDLGENEKVPSMILDMPVLKETAQTIYVKMNYPVVGEIFTLNGEKGAHSSYVEAGKKAFVRGGKYVHPSKGWSSKIVMMPPMVYIEECWIIFRGLGADKRSVEDLIQYKESEYDLDKVFGPLAGDLNYPVLDYKRKAQEGLHRAIYALRRNIKAIPVVVIN